VKHVILTRAAYGPGWDVDANRRRLAMTRAVTIPSLAAQTNPDFTWIVLLHRRDAILDERRAAFRGAKLIYTDIDGTPDAVAFDAYKAGWARAIGSRQGMVAMTRLDDDDAFAPWAMARVREEAEKRTTRTILMLPIGIRVWQGGYTFVQHRSNAMQTLVTPPGDKLTVYDYGHRTAHKVARIKGIDARPAWLWSRHPDTLSGWRVSDRPLNDDIRALFPIDWSVFGSEYRKPSRTMPRGRSFR
jgi:hypothetical protein